MEQERVAEIAQLAARDRVDLRLVPQEPSDRPGVDGQRHVASPSETARVVPT
jgi:hypothetical protein